MGGKFCRYCGLPTANTSARFCRGCGKPLAAPARLQTTAPARRRNTYWVRHACALGLLLGTLLVALVTVFRWEAGRERPVVSAPPATALPADEDGEAPGYASSGEPVISIGYRADGRFGVRTTEGDPARQDDDNKLLTFSPSGDTSNTRLWVDGDTPIIGSGGTWRRPPGQEGERIAASWEYRGVRVDQNLKLIAVATGKPRDTMRVEYTLRNTDTRPHAVGVRAMIDTLIGNNDGVPFVVPGRVGVTTTACEMEGEKVPEFVQALETGELTNPGVIVRITLRDGEKRPDRVVLSGWAGGDMPWEYLAALGGTGASLRRGGNGEPDSAIGIYYSPRTLAPGAKRKVAFYYGLGGVSSTKSRNARLSLSCAPRVREGESFQVVALVSSPRPGDRLRLSPGEGLALAANEPEERAVPPAEGQAFTQVSWVVTAQRARPQAELTATLMPASVAETLEVEIAPGTLTR